jgi:RNA polymerase sigma-70 factor (ECF subfamily)
MISSSPPGHRERGSMEQAQAGTMYGEVVEAAPPNSRRGAPAVRLRGLVDTYFDFVWRALRRLGVPEASIDDAVQQVWIVTARKLEDITAGQERAFVFGTALRVAADARRAQSRRLEAPQRDIDAQDPALPADEALDDRRARAILDEVLAAMPDELRVVFVLFELEEMSTAQIAQTLQIPTGTAASRLRRAREEFQQIVKRRKARDRRAPNG